MHGKAEARSKESERKSRFAKALCGWEQVSKQLHELAPHLVARYFSAIRCHAAPVPLSRAAEAYIAERNSERGRMNDIQPHRLWPTSDAGEVEFVGLRVVENQNLLLTR